ncbi:hypothetical protein CEXT_612701 [Caerostris extrusa]|uniref:Uncharacterized protein n=1 Tax=Caerostris extrusa TaxID=172846 RepID=A0AAV4XFN7_CAEEX|nr:hypothetical protein CEXT_612701 [Caerostris extrusa]
MDQKIQRDEAKKGLEKKQRKMLSVSNTKHPNVDEGQTQQSKDDGSISNPVSLGMNLISRSQSLTSLNDDTNRLQRANVPKVDFYESKRNWEMALAPNLFNLSFDGNQQ